MTTKLRGSRLEAEVDRARADGNWKRLAELLHAMKSKHSGMEDMVELVEAELELETFLEQQGEVLRPSHDYANGLREAEMLLNETVERRSEGTVLEAHLLLAKLHYACASYTQALKDIENSGMELANTPFRTLRALRLVAEVYAIKGIVLFYLEKCFQIQRSVNKEVSSAFSMYYIISSITRQVCRHMRSFFFLLFSKFLLLAFESLFKHFWG
ncbi:unnamed protein product [Haemonchus placei]|uniref:TTC7_N domain-containing protein n=1 Tax=Haemonchus placei TaxID=6290 RepID=A0A0N4WG33_HAEPC|nr:unnamed protein product [Haemonchus placei]